MADNIYKELPVMSQADFDTMARAVLVKDPKPDLVEKFKKILSQYDTNRLDISWKMRKNLGLPPKKLTQEEFDTKYNMLQSSTSKEARAALAEDLAYSDTSGAKKPKGYNVPDLTKQKPEIFTQDPKGRDAVTVKSSGVQPETKTIQSITEEERIAQMDELARQQEARAEIHRANKLETKPVTKSIRPEVEPSIRKKAVEAVDEAAEVAGSLGKKAAPAVEEAESLLQKVARNKTVKAAAGLAGPAIGVAAKALGPAMALKSGDLLAATPFGESEVAGEGSDLIPGATQPAYQKSDLSLTPQLVKGVGEAARGIGDRAFNRISQLVNPNQLASDIDTTKEVLGNAYNSARESIAPQNYQDVDEKFKFFKGKSADEVDNDLGKMGFKIEQPEEESAFKAIRSRLGLK